MICSFFLNIPSSFHTLGHWPLGHLAANTQKMQYSFNNNCLNVTYETFEYLLSKYY
jgi:hypothetical protein